MKKEIKRKVAKHKNEESHEFLIAQATKLCENNALVFQLTDICVKYGIINYEDIQHNRDIFKAFNALLNSRYTLFIDKDGDVGITSNSETDAESNELFIVMCLGVMAMQGINIEYLEKHNSKFKGLSDFLSLEFPELHNAYMALSDQYGFSNFIEYDNSIPSDSGLMPDEADNYHRLLLYMMKGLGDKIKDQDLNEVKAILESFSDLDSKCTYSLENGNICYAMSDDSEFFKTTESAIIIALGIFASHEINLEYLESENPLLKGLNDYLRQYESYNAYSAITKKYRFDSTVLFSFPEQGELENLRN